MTNREFTGICELHGFGHVASILQEYLLPCVGFTLHSDPSNDVSASKLGGVPAVPRSFEWPLYNGRPLDFLLQINLQEVNRHDSTGVLPAKGVLALFYELEEQPWGYDPKNLSFFKVCFFPENIDLSERQRPEHRLNSAMLEERRIDFWPAATLPNYGSRAWARLTKLIEVPDTDFDFSAFHRLSEAVFRAAAPTSDGPRHQLGGHSQNIQNDMQLEAQLVTNGLYCGDASGYTNPRRPALEKTCEDWQLLLQLDSDESAKLMWGDVGMLYFWVRQVDLLQRDFSRSWMTLQCG